MLTVIVYDELEGFWRREFHSLDLQPLRQGFFKDLASYARRLGEAQQNLDAKSLKALVLEDELLRLDHLLSQLLTRRYNKISSREIAIYSSSLESVEKQANETLSTLHRDYERMMQDVVTGREPRPNRSKKAGFVVVRFEKKVPSIVGGDLKAHGPFEKEDVATLPQENAESLTRQGATVEIATSDQDNE